MWEFSEALLVWSETSSASEFSCPAGSGKLSPPPAPATKGEPQPPRAKVSSLGWLAQTLPRPPTLPSALGSGPAQHSGSQLLCSAQASGPPQCPGGQTLPNAWGQLRPSAQESDPARHPSCQDLSVPWGRQSVAPHRSPGIISSICSVLFWSAEAPTHHTGPSNLGARGRTVTPRPSPQSSRRGLCAHRS
jgi:hypothetical protein